MKRSIILVMSVACFGMSGCFSIDDYIHVTKEDPKDPDDVYIPDDPSDEIPDQDEQPTHPGGSEGVTPGDDSEEGTSPGGDIGKVEDPVILTLEAVSPSRGNVDGGYEVRIRGSHLDESGSVMFGQLKSPQVIYVNDKVVRAVVPQGKKGCVDVFWIQGEETSKLEGGFCYHEEIRLLDIHPSTVVEGQTTLVTVDGNGFDEDVRVSFSNEVRSELLLDMNVQSDMRLTGTMPDMEPGAVRVLVTSASNKILWDRFITVLPKLIVNSGLPVVLPSMQKQSVRVLGSGFSSQQHVMVDGREAEVSNDGDNALSIEIPALAAGHYDVVLYDDYRQLRIRDGVYVYRDNDAQTAQIFGVSPTFASVAGGEAVDIFGTALGTDGTASFGGALGSPVTQTHKHWRVTVPTHEAGVVDLQIHEAMLPLGFQFIPYPELFEIVPEHAQAGKKILLRGKNFGEDLRVWIGNYEATVERYAPEEIELTVPPGSGSKSIVLQRAEAGIDTEKKFTYDEVVTITGMSSHEAAINGGMEIEIYGGKFDNGMRVYIDHIPVESVLESANCLKFKVPAVEMAKEVSVEIYDANGNLSAADTLTYINPSGMNTGAGGGTLDGTIHVTVLKSGTGLPLPEAVVYIGSDWQTAIKGITDTNGRVTISDRRIAGAQIVTACASGFSCGTMQPVNARNITLLLEEWADPNNSSSSQDPPAPQPPQDGVINPIDMTVPYTPKPSYFTGTVGDFGKVELESDPNHIRAGLVMQSALSAYTYPYDKDDVYFLKESGATYRIRARSGDVALALVCGIFNKATNEFYPKYFGIKRHLFVTDGKNIQNHLDCPLPLNQSQSIKLLDAPLHSGPNVVKANAYIFVGDEGYIGGFMSGTSATDYVVITQIPPFREELSGAKLVLSAGAYTNGGYPATVYSSGLVSPTKDIVELGPAAPLPVFKTKESDDILKTGILAWSVEYPKNVDFYALTVRMYSSSHRGDLLYQAYLPATATSVELPTVYQWPDDLSGMIYVQLAAYQSVRKGFDFNLFSTAELRYNYIKSSAYSTLYIYDPKRMQAK